MENKVIGMETLDIKKAQSALEDLFVETDEQSGKYIVERLETQCERYVGFITGFTEERIRFYRTGEQEILRDTVIENIGSFYDSLIKSVQAYLNGRFDECRNIIYDNFFVIGRPRKNPLPVYRMNEEKSAGAYVLFRIRKNDSYVLYKTKEMFHIPFEKRGLVYNQRFSMSGYPCLYMGTSIYGCWEETQRPDVDMCNIIALKTDRPLKFVSLCIPTIEPTVGLFAGFLYTMVLRLACSLKVQKSDDYFKPEYILPQMVLSCIVRRNHSDVDDKYRYAGIRYTSNVYRQTQDMFGEKRLLVNYVLPIKESTREGLCENLLEMFEVTEPTSLIHERLKRNAGAVILNSRTAGNLYQQTEFGLLEAKLKNRTFSKIRY